MQRSAAPAVGLATKTPFAPPCLSPRIVPGEQPRPAWRNRMSGKSCGGGFGGRRLLVMIR